MDPNGYNLKYGGSAGKHSPSTLIRLKAIGIEINARPGMRQITSETTKVGMARQEVKDKMAETNLRLDVKLRRSRIAAELWLDPKVRLSRIIAITAAHARPDVKIRHTASLNKIEVRDKLSKVRSDMRWINDGHKNRRLPSGTPLPLNWIYGRTKFKRFLIT